jgi:serine phosphatase RsbU (regulator of sigma subunit)
MPQGRKAGELRVTTAALVTPARDEPVGGDFHLVQAVDSRTVVVVGDVTGSGVDAAPYADRLCAELSEIARTSSDPAELLEELNIKVYGEAGFDRFGTACALIIDRSSRAAAWAFAGHLPPHWLDTGVPVDGAVPGLPLGVEERCGAVSAQRRPLHPTEGFLVFTDGLEDVRGPGGDRFGFARSPAPSPSSCTGPPPGDRAWAQGRGLQLR